MASTASARSTGNVFVGSRAANFGTRGFDVSWELDLFGSNRHNVRAAAAEMIGAEDARRGAQVSLLAELAKNLAKNYVEVCCARQQMAVTQARIQARRETLELTRLSVVLLPGSPYGDIWPRS